MPRQSGEPKPRPRRGQNPSVFARDRLYAEIKRRYADPYIENGQIIVEIAGVWRVVGSISGDIHDPLTTIEWISGPQQQQRDISIGDRFRIKDGAFVDVVGIREGATRQIEYRRDDGSVHRRRQDLFLAMARRSAKA